MRQCVFDTTKNVRQLVLPTLKNNVINLLFCLPLAKQHFELLRSIYFVVQNANDDVSGNKFDHKFISLLLATSRSLSKRL